MRPVNAAWMSSPPTILVAVMVVIVGKYSVVLTKYQD
jgi:hypothetical protein